MDELDDRELSAALRGRADELTAGVVDTDAALDIVQQRGRTRRRWRAATTGVLAAAAATVGVLAVTSVVGDDQVVRTPATSPIADSSVATTVATASTTTMTTTPAPTMPPTAPATTAPSTTLATAPTAGTPSVPAAAPTLATYNSVGGSITVRQDGEEISLAEDPVPAPGFSVRIDDNGPDRVRVRFERDEQRSEIRVDVENGELVPQITDG